MKQLAVNFFLSKTWVVIKKETLLLCVYFQVLGVSRKYSKPQGVRRINFENCKFVVTNFASPNGFFSLLTPLTRVAQLKPLLGLDKNPILELSPMASLSFSQFLSLPRSLLFPHLSLVLYMWHIYSYAQHTQYMHIFINSRDMSSNFHIFSL